MEKILNSTSVKTMQADYDLSTPREPNLESIKGRELNAFAARYIEMRKKRATEPADPAKKLVNHVRKGIIGDWKNHFDEDQNNRMNRRIYEKLTGTAAEYFIDIWKQHDVL